MLLHSLLYMPVVVPAVTICMLGSSRVPISRSALGDWNNCARGVFLYNETSFDHRHTKCVYGLISSALRNAEGEVPTDLAKRAQLRVANGI